MRVRVRVRLRLAVGVGAEALVGLGAPEHPRTLHAPTLTRPPCRGARLDQACLWLGLGLGLAFVLGLALGSGLGLGSGSGLGLGLGLGFGGQLDLGVLLDGVGDDRADEAAQGKLRVVLWGVRGWD